MAGGQKCPPQPYLPLTAYRPATDQTLDEPGPTATASSAGSMVTTAGWDARFCASPRQRAHLLGYARLPERSSACLPRTVVVVPTHKGTLTSHFRFPHVCHSFIFQPSRNVADFRTQRGFVRASHAAQLPCLSETNSISQRNGKRSKRFSPGTEFGWSARSTEA